ncbi:peptidoglycan editing factor PgeF [uncultured Parasutterella sp.]|uniref:peptidoglycan editing factor PgeF n=1 Tax=uncultured Parasutterella sp. TaxID=1263098 RepID=UPI00259AC527|nr:peptidoglycan editing factor PgeF [uncultured Parasutterella sp.]
MRSKPELEVLVPQWPVPANVKAFFTLRSGGLSAGAYGAEDGFNGLNLGDHVEDSPYAVKANRAMVTEMIGSEAAWLRQIHSTIVLEADQVKDAPQADAAFTTHSKVPCVVMTADCVPVLFCEKNGKAVAAAHAGWRGLADGVLQACVEAMSGKLEDSSAEIMAWIGPHIRKESFEIREDVADYYRNSKLSGVCGEAIEKKADGSMRLDLSIFVREALRLSGVSEVYDCGLDTFSDPKRFYSYRRSGRTGRHGAFIYKL